MEIFINGTGCISPQNSFEDSAFTLSLLRETDLSRLKTIEPEYKNHINPSLLRRMSRMIRMGIASSKICLEKAGITMPDAIITGTGLGCIEDTEKFISSILENNEQLLTPTPFIQSTHNTVGGQIALLLGCHAYNYTYVHRGVSFESSLLDAMMLIQEKSAEHVLVGGIDELTDNSYKLLRQLGIYSRKDKIPSDLSEGTPGGEGSAFFLVSGKKATTSLAKISLVRTFTGKISTSSLTGKIRETFTDSGKHPKEVGLLLSGKSGQHRYDVVLEETLTTIFGNTTTLPFKQYCGEYHTASAFALWLAVKKLQEGSLSSVLICNHFGGEDHSIMLIEKC